MTKIICVALIVAGMISLAILKVFLPSLETSLINSVLMQLLTIFGVVHVTTPKDTN